MFVKLLIKVLFLTIRICYRDGNMAISFLKEFKFGYWQGFLTMI